MFPNVDINVLGNLGKQYVKDPENIKIKDGAVNFLTYEGMKRIGYKSETLDELTADVKDVMSAGGFESENMTTRQKQKKKEKAVELAGKAQKGAAFLMEELNFDHLTIDEAHNMKNVFERAASSGKKAANEFRYITGASSERGVKAFLHSQYIQKNNGDRNVTLLTATPFTNSPIEIYSMLSHVARDKLQEKKLTNINDFISHFVEIKQEYVIKGNGQIQMQDVAKGFKNLKELQEIVKDAIDFKTGAEVKIKRPAKKEHLIELPPTDEQRAIIEEAEREYLKAQKASKEEKDKNPAAMLIAIDKQRKATLSPKLVTGKGHFVKDSPKLKYTFDSVAKVHKQRPEVGQVVYLPRGIDYYHETTQYLREQHGIAPSSVAFMTSKTSDIKKQEIMDEFNDPKGKIKIIVGSETIKEGVNLQANTAVLYNTFLGWNPTELEQLRGRIWRYGNKQKNVNIVYPVNVDSIDSVMYQKHDEKSKRIAEIWKFKGDYVDVSPIDPFETKYEIIKDPEKRAEFKIKLDTDDLKKKLADKVSALARIKRVQETQGEAKRDVEKYKKEIAEAQELNREAKRKLPEIEKDLKDAKKIGNAKLIEDLEKQKKDIKYFELDRSVSVLRSLTRVHKKAADQFRIAQEQLVSLGIKDEKEADLKVQALQKEHTELKAEIESKEKNKEKYIAQARREIAAMQKPVSSIKESTKNMVSQVLSSINETDRAIQEKQKQERFAASLFGSSFLKPKNRRIIDDFLSRAS